MKRFSQCILALMVMLFAFHAAAQDKVVVIPLNSAKKLKNVVTVSASGGDFTDPVAAVNSISGASSANPYLVLIGPGVYTLTQPLPMKAFVTIAGSGREATILTGAISSADLATSAIVLGANDATLRDLTVENTGGGSVSIALYNDNDSPVVSNAAFLVSGGAIGNVGVVNLNSSSPTLADTNIEATGGAECYGVSNNSGSKLTMTGANVSATGGTDNYGVRNAGASEVMIINSFISCVMSLPPVPGTTYTVIKIDNAAGVIKIVRSTLRGFTVESSGVLSCAQSDNGDYELDIDCIPLIPL